MAASDLYDLVRKLDSDERKRVKTIAKRSNKEGPIVYLDLFEDLCKTASYSTDTEFLAAHHNPSYAKSFAQMKPYLFDIILDALRSYRTRAGEEKPRDFQIRELIEEAYILRGKLLPSQSLLRLEKAREEAEACQFYELLLETLKLLRTHHNEQGNKDKAIELQSILKRIREVGDLIQMNCQLIVYRDEFFGHVRRNADPAPSLGDQLQEQVRHIHALKALESDSKEAKTNHHLSLALHAWINKEPIRSWGHHHQVYLLWKDQDDFVRERKVQHIKLLNNFLTMSIAAGKSEDFIEALSFLETHAGTSLDAKAESKQNTAYIRLQYFLSKADWDNASKIEDEFKEKPDWVTLKTNAPRLQIFYLSFARLHFVMGDYKNAKKYIGWFEEEKNPTRYHDKRAEAIALKVIILFSEKSNAKKTKASDKEIDILNEIRAARRAMDKLNDTPTYLVELLKGIKRIANLDAEKRITAWHPLLLSIQSKVGLPEYDSASQLFLAWIQSQAEDKPLSDLLKKDFPTYQG